MHVQRHLSIVLSGTYPDVRVHLLKHVGFSRLANGFLLHWQTECFSAIVKDFSSKFEER